MLKSHPLPVCFIVVAEETLARRGRLATVTNECLVALRKGEGASQAAPLGVRCGNLCNTGSPDYQLPSRRVRSSCFQSSPCRGVPSRFPSGILTRWVPSVERGRAVNLDDPSTDFAPLGILRGEPQSSSSNQAPFSWSPFWLQGLRESSPVACFLLTVGCLPGRRGVSAE